MRNNDFNTKENNADIMVDVLDNETQESKINELSSLETGMEILELPSIHGIDSDKSEDGSTWVIILDSRKREEDEEEEDEYEDDEDYEDEEEYEDDGEYEDEEEYEGEDPNDYDTIKLHSKGNDVERLQELLNDWGYEVDIDGVFGKGTRKAVIELQKDNDLDADGIVGYDTWDLLLNYVPDDDTEYDDEEFEEDSDDEEYEDEGDDEEYEDEESEGEDPNDYETLKIKSRGDDVETLQNLLNEWGYEIDTDGIFGKGTKKAVMQLQEDYGLEADGIVGYDTWDLLLNYSPSEDEEEYEEPEEEYEPDESGEEYEDEEYEDEEPEEEDSDDEEYEDEEDDSESHSLLKKGCEGKEVKLLQDLLNDWGYDVNPDGDFGRSTRNAVKKFQEDNDLDADGIVGPATWEILLSEPEEEDDYEEENEEEKPSKILARSKPVTSTPVAMALLKLNSHGSEVKKLQNLLVSRGYDVDQDGIFGRGTRKAVMEFQEDNGLDADGIVGKGTWAALRESAPAARHEHEEEPEIIPEKKVVSKPSYTVLKYRSKGSEVKRLQVMLSRLGYDVSQDGIFGNGTKRAVMQFQEDNGLDADGIVGRGTWAALNSAEPVEKHKEVPVEKHVEKPERKAEKQEESRPAAKVLKVRSVGSDVKKLQTMLARLGYDVSQDGIFGNGTKRAVMQFQEDNGLDADGIVGRGTWAALNSAEPVEKHKEEPVKKHVEKPERKPEKQEESRPAVKVLKVRSIGSEVKKLQTMLARLGYDVSQDGIFGNGTKRAVMQFQEDYGLDADGIAGRGTWDALNNAEPAKKKKEEPIKKRKGETMNKPEKPASKVLKLSSAGNDVLNLQKKLSRLGYSVSKDGVFGSGTQRAVIEFQQDHGLGADGIVGRGTWAAIDSTDPNRRKEEEEEENKKQPESGGKKPHSVLKLHSKGSEVKQLQKLLADLGYEVSQDGIFGNGTKRAVIEFQENNGLEADGIVGKGTWEVLLSGKAVRSKKGGSSDKPKDSSTKNPSKLLKLNSTGEEVEKLQELLKELKYNVDVNGVFDIKTKEAVIDFQLENGLVADGIVGKGTWDVLLNGNPQPHDPANDIVGDEEGGSITLTENDYIRAAKILRVEVAAIKAVKEVEAKGSGFFRAGYPKILFEGHIFWRQLKKINIDPNKYVEGNEDILYPKWVRGHYLKGIQEYSRLSKAEKINESAARQSASWGLFQIMGFNYKGCGCSTLDEFMTKVKRSEGGQLELFVRLLMHNGWDKYLRALDWAGFAKHYNGPAYAQNKYDQKLLAAYNKYK